MSQFLKIGDDIINFDLVYLITKTYDDRGNKIAKMHIVGASNHKQFTVDWHYFNNCILPYIKYTDVSQTNKLKEQNKDNDTTVRTEF